MMRSKPFLLMTSAAATLSVKVVTSMPSISRIALTASHTLASSSTTIDLNLSMDRQPHRKSRSLPLGTRDLDIAAVFLDDAVAHGQAEPRALECLLGGEKGVKDLVDVFFRDAAAGVGKNDLDGVSVFARDHFDPARRRNGMDRVQEHVHDDLADLGGVRLDFGKVFVEFHLQLDALEGVLGLERVSNLGYGPVDVDHLR